MNFLIILSYFIISLHHSSCVEFLLCPLISSVSYSLQLTKVKAIRTLQESISVYTALIAEPGTGKSPAMTLVRDCMQEIEKYYQVTDENSKLVNGKLSFIPKFPDYYN